MGPTEVVIALLVGACALVAVAVAYRSWRGASGRVRGLESRLQSRLEQVEARDERLTRREATLESKVRTLELRESNFLERERTLTARSAEIDDALIAQRKRLEEIADLTADEARQALVDQVEAEARADALVYVRDVEARAREEAERRARQIVATAIQRVAVDTTATGTVSDVTLPDEALKGRIIGRDGRNVRAFEQITGANLVIDDTPGVVLVSCFDPLRREVARITLAALVEDGRGRINPARIEEEHDRAKDRVDTEVAQAGRDACEEADVPGVSEELVKLLGQLTYRTSYGQNVLRHAVETAHFAGVMADELGMDGTLARRCGLLHDIGKALTHRVQGSHARIGAEIAGRLGEPTSVCHAIEAHHNEVEPRTVEAVLTQAADAISASRPGARRDAHEQFVTRLRRIEELCGSCDGVAAVHAMQAGREVRVMVRPDTVDDAAARTLARELAGRIEDELAYPGQITITVIRELRATEIAH